MRFLRIKDQRLELPNRYQFSPGLENSIKIELVNNENYYEYSIDGLISSFKSIFIHPSGQHTAFVRTIPDVTQWRKDFTVFTYQNISQTTTVSMTYGK
jgi:hypothetical protein